MIVGVTPDGNKECVAIADGFRESTASWREVLLDLNARGLQCGPLLPVGAGAMGFWAACLQGWYPGAGRSAGTTETRRLTALRFRPAVHDI